MGINIITRAKIDLFLKDAEDGGHVFKEGWAAGKYAEFEITTPFRMNDDKAKIAIWQATEKIAENILRFVVVDVSEISKLEESDKNDV